jgi:hypothetical protein
MLARMTIDRVVQLVINQQLIATLRIRLFLLRPDGQINVYLDDRRLAPRGWYRARHPKHVIDLVKTGHVSHVSLDFDLGLDSHGDPIEGYQFVLWLENEVVHGRQLPIPELKVHSGNIVGHERLLRAVESIERIAAGDDPRFPLKAEAPTAVETSSP